jgi:hypothetical protein
MSKTVGAMFGNQRMARYRTGIFSVIALSACITFTLPAQGQSNTVPAYTANGELLAPAGFETWVFVGSNLGLAYKPELPAMTALEGKRADQPQFHNVYIDKEAYAHFLATGEFPDPTILVMEKFAAADKEPKGIVTSGVFNGNRVGVEVAVKNLSRPDGRTTAWAYYDLTDPSDSSKLRASAPAFPDQICESCHRQHASKDNVWVQFYPTLRTR